MSAYLCTNAERTHKMSITIIGKSRNLHAFQNQKLPSNYLSKRKAWSNVQLFENRYDEILAPFVWSRTKNYVALLFENSSSQSNINITRGIQIILRPNETSIHQPMDMGIVRV